MPASARRSPWDVFAVRVRRGAARRLARALALMRQRPVTSVPSRILFAPESVRDADPAVAEDIYAGVFALAGAVADTAGRSPFEIEPPSEAWARALHGFTWLVHLDANATELSSTNARALFDDWLRAPAANGPIASEPGVMADRVMSWLSDAPLLLNGAPAEFRQRYLRALGRQLRRLERSVAALPTGLTRLRAASALALAGVCVADEGRLMRTGLALVAQELSAQVHPDGGHRSRGPGALVDALAALLPLREALVRRRLDVPQPLATAIDRMLPMVRFFLHGDGRLAAFHDAALTPPGLVEQVLTFDDVEGTAAANARYTGFQRLEDGEALVLLDTGGAPEPGFGDSAHASALAFEFSHGESRIVVGCGPLGAVRPQWSDAARESAAHSTLILAGTSSARVMGEGVLRPVLGTPLVGGPREVLVERSDTVVRASHDGYRARYGLDHQRRLQLAQGGLILIGEDRLAGEGRLDRLSFAVRFHFCPGIRVRLHKNARQALLSLRDGALWVFSVDEGPELCVEESIAVEGPHDARRTFQIVIAGNALTDHTVRWHLARRAGPIPAEPEAEPAAEPQTPKATP